MISFKRKKETFTEPLDEQLFYQLLRDKRCNGNIDRFRQTGNARYKNCLPAFCFQANFDETVKEVKNRNTGETKKVKGRWSVQKATNLTGLVVLDIDHVENPLEIYERWKSFDFNQLGILFVFVTPSGKGIKVVFKANIQWGNLADNQIEMGRILDVEPDESGKDASRIAFICKEEDVLYLDKELFTYEDKKFARKFNAQYRNGHSAPTGKVGNVLGEKTLKASPHDNVMGDSFRVENPNQPVSVGTGVAGTHGYYAETLSASKNGAATHNGTADPKALPLSKGEYPPQEGEGVCCTPEEHTPPSLRATPSNLRGGVYESVDTREDTSLDGMTLKASPHDNVMGDSFRVDNSNQPVTVGTGVAGTHGYYAETLSASKSFKGIPYAAIIAEWWKQQGGEPVEGERNTELHRLAVHLRTICDNNSELLLEIMPNYGLDVAEMESIIASATKDQPKGKTKEIKAVLQALGIDDLRNKALPLSKGEYPPQEGEGVCCNPNEHTPPSLRDTPSNLGGGVQECIDAISQQLLYWGDRIETLSEHFPQLKDICKGLKKNQFTAAMFVAGALMMTLMTRCTYRFYHRPEELRRLNSSLIIEGDPASGKSFATRLFKILMAPIVAADKVGRDAINAYRELMKTKGANKEKPKKPKAVVRIHPARTSNAQFIQDMVNAVEEVDGEPMQLHMLTFDTELDNTLSIQKGGSWIDKLSLELKAFHNEEDGQAYSNVDSIMQDFYVTWNFVYTGTPIALKKKVTESNFGSGLATRLTCIPLPSTNFEMMTRETTIDYESDNRLKEWAIKLDRTKGELSVQKIVDELYEWTARRMADAKDNESKADEMLLKRCAYHGLNYAAPFIVMRHWEELKKDGDFFCGEFETDEIDWQLAELIVNIQYACQKHYFGAMAEMYFDNKLKEASMNHQHRQRTVECFHRLPDEFTAEDVMKCFNLATLAAARSKIARLMSDKIIKKINGKRGKNLFCKTGIMMC